MLGFVSLSTVFDLLAHSPYETTIFLLINEADPSGGMPPRPLVICLKHFSFLPFFIF